MIYKLKIKYRNNSLFLQMYSILHDNIDIGFIIFYRCENEHKSEL